MGNSVLPSIINKASDWLNGVRANANNAGTTAESVESTGTAKGSVFSSSANDKFDISKDYGTFDFKYDATEGDTLTSGDRAQCKEAYDKWKKSDDYTSTTNKYDTLTKKQTACNSTLNKVKNFFGGGQTWTSNDQTQYDNLMSHIDAMTTRGGIGQ